MSSITGNNIKLSVFGESHGKYVGATLDNLPAGYKIDEDNIRKELLKRKAKGNISTSRIEPDTYEIISGVFNGYSTGAPITIIIKNENIISKDYESSKDIARPSHSDYVANIKYRGYQDYRGAGHFSARLTAPIVACCSICKDILKSMGIEIISHIKSIGDISAHDILDINIDNQIIKKLDTDFPVIEDTIEEKYRKEILNAKKNGDSVGGSVQTAVLGMKCGYGSPYFDSLEAQISSIVFSVPGVKAIEFGKGIQISKTIGSISNDELYYESDKVKTYTNNSGGINAGISNGNDLVFTTYLRPTPTISVNQKTINMKTKKDVTLSSKGRHDPCIVHRASHVITNITAFKILDIMLYENK